METRASYVIVGAFVLTLFAAGMGFVIWLGKLDIDKQVKNYHIYFGGSVTGLSVGSAVSYRGIPVGSVTKLRLDPENVEQVEVTVEIDPQTPIKEDAIATLETRGLTGIGYIQIQGGTQHAAELEPEGGREFPIIPSKASALERVFESAPEIAQELKRLTARASAFLNDENQENFASILSNVAIVTQSFADRKDALDETITNTHSAVANVTTMTETLIPMMKTMNEQIEDLVLETNATLSTIRGSAAGIDAEFTGVAAEFNQTAQEIREMTGDARSLLRASEGPVKDFAEVGLYELTEFLVEARLLVANLNRLTRGLDRDPTRILFGDRGTGVEAEK